MESLSKKTTKIIFIALFSVLCTTSYAQFQRLDVLNEQRQKAEAEIARIDSELRSLESSKKNLSSQLRLTIERLNKRQEVLRSIDAQISILDNRARTQSALATQHNQQLESLKLLYQQNILKLYNIEQTTSKSGSLLSSEYRKRKVHIEHMAKLLDAKILAQCVEINSIQGELGDELKEISQRKKQLDILKTDEAQAIKLIAQERKRIENLNSQLSRDQKKLREQQEAQRKSLDELQKRIEDIIKAEMGKGASTSSNSTLGENDPLSIAFARGKLRMSSPLSPSSVVDKFGIHNHPTQSGIKVNNNGVNLKGNSSSTVRCISDGEVRKVFVVPSMGTSVLVRHGAYLTVYSNLKTINVKQGDKLEASMALGTVGDDGILHFEIWRETTALNPEQWIKF